MFSAIALLAILADGQTIERVFVQDSDVYAVYADGARRLTADGRPKRLAVVSPDRSRIAFLADAGQAGLGKLVILSADGAALRETTLRPGLAAGAGAMKAIEEVQWLTPDRLVISGGFSAAAAEYVIVDADTGRELRSYFVRGFAWSPSPRGGHVAYEYYEGPRFCVDNDCRGRISDQVEYRWPAAWSEDGTQVAIVANHRGVRAPQKTVIVKNVAGKFTEVATPFYAQGDFAIGWEGADLVLVSDESRWKLNADESEFVEMRK